MNANRIRKANQKSGSIASNASLASLTSLNIVTMFMQVALRAALALLQFLFLHLRTVFLSSSPGNLPTKVAVFTQTPFVIRLVAQS